MAKAGAIRAGRAYVEVGADHSKLARGLRRAQAQLKAFGAGVRAIGMRMAAASAAVFGTLGTVATRAAASAQESLSRFKAVFKEQADAAREFADTLAREVGRSKYAAYDALATFQSFFTGLGFGAAKSRKLSERLTALALDFASFHNIADEEAMQRFISALSGSSEVLDRFGINIKQAALQQELLARGVSKSWTQVTEQEKAVARLGIIMRAMGQQGAVGDAIRTAGSFTNQMKKLRGEWHDAKVELGNALLPSLTLVVTKLATAARLAGAWVSANKPLVASVFKVGAAVFAAGLTLVVLGFGIAAAGGALGGLATMLAATKAVLLALLSPIVLVVAAVAGLGAAILMWTGAGGAALEWLGDKFGRLGDFVGEVLGGIRKALVAGDIGLAADVLWAGLRVAWETGALELMKVWNALESAWVAVVTEMWRLWVNFQSDLGKTGAIAAHYAAEAWIDQQERMGVLSRRQAKRRRQELDVEFLEEAAGRAPALYEALEKLLAGKGDTTASEAAIARAVRALKAAQAALDKSLKEAGAATPFDWGKPGRDWKKDWDAAMNALEDVGGKVAMRVQAVGTFNPLAARGLTGKLAADRTAKATEGTEKEVRRLREWAENNPLAWLP